MLKQFIKKDAGEAAAAFWRLSQNPENQSYPLYKSLVAVNKEFRVRACGKQSALFGYYQGDRLIGVLCYFALPKDNYLQTVAFQAEESYEAVYATFLAHLAENYAGYEVLIGITAENTRAAAALEASGYFLTEASTDMHLHRSGFVYEHHWNMQIERITKETFHEYAPFHYSHYGIFYWNAERLCDKADEWYIFVFSNGEEIGGSMFLTVYQYTAEVFGFTVVDSPCPCDASDFMKKALAFVFCDNASVTDVIFQVGEKEEKSLAAAKETGFEMYGNYRCYTLRL